VSTFTVFVYYYYSARKRTVAHAITDRADVKQLCYRVYHYTNAKYCPRVVTVSSQGQVRD